MKSNVILLTGEAGQHKAVMHEVDKCTAYNEFDQKSALRTRLLAEELVGMLPSLLKHTSAAFWMEAEGKAIELHAEVKAKDSGFNTRQKVLSVSTSGKNVAAVGIMGKIRETCEMMLYPSTDEVVSPSFYEMGMEHEESSLSSFWSLRQYSDSVQELIESAAKEAAWDELEKSIIARLADDVIVSIKGKNVEIIVRKAF